MSTYRLFKGLALTTAGSVLIATSAIALNDIRTDAASTQCTYSVPKISVHTLP